MNKKKMEFMCSAYEVFDLCLDSFVYMIGEKSFWRWKYAVEQKGVKVCGGGKKTKIKNKGVKNMCK